MDNLSPQQWLTLKKPTRDALVKIFRIPQSTYTHVVNNVVESDGHTFNDLKAISVETMKELTHSASESFEEQFGLIIKMVESDGDAVAAPQENATLNGPEVTTVSTPISGEVAAGVIAGAKAGSQPQAQVNQEPVLPVPGGEQQVNRGRDELLPDTDNNDRAGVAAEKTEVSPEQPKAGKAGRPR